MVGKLLLQVKNCEIGVSVSNFNAGARVRVGCMASVDRAGEAVHVAGSCNCVGFASVGPSGCWLQTWYPFEAAKRTTSQIPRARVDKVPRSEEHTSELQLPCNLVCRLLLEKKKL